MWQTETLSCKTNEKTLEQILEHWRTCADDSWWIGQILQTNKVPWYSFLHFIRTPQLSSAHPLQFYSPRLRDKKGRTTTDTSLNRTGILLPGESHISKKGWKSNICGNSFSLFYLTVQFHFTHVRFVLFVNGWRGFIVLCILQSISFPRFHRQLFLVLFMHFVDCISWHAMFGRWCK